MDARTVRLIEQSVERTAAALFGAAVGYAAYGVATTQLPRPVAIAGGMVTLIFAALLCAVVLSRIGIEAAEYDLAAFGLGEVEPVLTDEELAAEPLKLEDAPDFDDALELDDVLADPAPDSRVVRMFAPEAMSTQIHRTVRDERGRPIPDAAQDLYQALADLRRSLR